MRSPFTLLSVSVIFVFASLTIAAEPTSEQVQCSSPRTRAQAAKAPQAKTYCIPGKPCWPKDFEWSSFNKTIGGRLIKVTPWAAPCYKDPDSAECKAIKDSYFNPMVRADQTGITQLDNWSSCTSIKTQEDCSLNINANGVPFVPANATCGLGRIAPYAVRIESAADAQAALAFAKKYRIHIVIKNTGHDYLGRSSGGSLTLWTHALKQLAYFENFQGKNAVAMGAGVLADAAYNFASEHGKSITLGAVGSVGVAGGFAMGGGHGPLGPTRGLAVDSILQFTVVTADGRVRTANASKNPDLFWALRGGGGGVYGLVLETVIQVYPDSQYTQLQFGISTKMSLNKDRTLIDFIAKLASYQEGWTDKGWAGYSFFYEDTILISAAVPNGDRAAAEQQMSGMLTYARTTLGLITLASSFTVHDNQNAYRKVIGAAADSITPIGYTQRLASRLIPRSAFTPESRQKLATDIVAAYRAAMPAASSMDGKREYLRTDYPLQIYSTGPRPASMGGPDGLNTGVNPAWRDSLWEVVVAGGWYNHLDTAGKQTIARAVHEAGDHLRGYGTGTYMNEADSDEVDWKTAYFGSNYDRLLSIKQRFDPESVFLTYKGVGWAGQESANSFKCYRNP